MRCIKKFNFFLHLLNEYQLFIIFFHEQVSEIIHLKKNIVKCAIIYPFRVI